MTLLVLGLLAGFVGGIVFQRIYAGRLEARAKANTVDLKGR